VTFGVRKLESLGYRVALFAYTFTVFGVQVDHSQYEPIDNKASLKEEWLRHVGPFLYAQLWTSKEISMTFH